jgi:cytochrome c556
MPKSIVFATLCTLLAVAIPVAHAADQRQLVEMPTPMHEHMLANMREHLVALGEIQATLAAGKFEQAADIAENRIGMNSLEAHGASHLAPYLPQPMQKLGTSMHRAVSRFARTAQEAEVEGGVPRALNALSQVTQQCAACHASYRLR